MRVELYTEEKRRRYPKVEGIKIVSETEIEDALLKQVFNHEPSTIKATKVINGANGELSIRLTNELKDEEFPQLQEEIEKRKQYIRKENESK